MAPYGRKRGTSKPESTIDTNVLDISASLYAVAQARSVALVAMQYSGASLDDAMRGFAAKLAQSLPGALCAGRNWEAPSASDRASTIDGFIAVWQAHGATR